MQNFVSFVQKVYDVEGVFCKMGIMFVVYGDVEVVEWLILFDIVLCIIFGVEWSWLLFGIEQCVMVLNVFFDDIYYCQEIVCVGIVLKYLIVYNEVFILEMIDFWLLGNVYMYIIGVDIVCIGENVFYVLEDNVCMLFGVFYMLENCEMMMQFFFELFQQVKVCLVEIYLQMLCQLFVVVCLLGGNVDNLIIVVFMFGIYNFVYYEYLFFVDQMGVYFVEGSDLQVIDGCVVMCMIEGFQLIDVLYCCVDDVFFDLFMFCFDLVFGVVGIMDVYCVGNIMIVNVFGIGIVDDKVIYLYMLEIVEFYMGCKVLLENVLIWCCGEVDSLKYVFEYFDELVVKEVYGLGGYGMLVGLCVLKVEFEVFFVKLCVCFVNYIV